MKNVAKVLIAVMLAWATAATAAIIYSNGPIASNGRISDTDFDPPTIVADDFILAAGANVITDVHWTGLYFQNLPTDNTPTEPDNFTIQFFAAPIFSPIRSTSLRYRWPPIRCTGSPSSTTHPRIPTIIGTGE